MNDRHANVLNYGICVFGVFGSLLFSGVFGSVSSTILFFWGLLSLGIVLISGFCLIGNLLVNVPQRSERSIDVLQLLTNILPSVSLVIGYIGKAYIYTPPGCCKTLMFEGSTGLTSCRHIRRTDSTMRSSFHHISFSLNTLESISPEPHCQLRSSRIFRD